MHTYEITSKIIVGIKIAGGLKNAARGTVITRPKVRLDQYSELRYAASVTPIPSRSVRRAGLGLCLASRDHMAGRLGLRLGARAEAGG